jgi:hypothetical protein
MKNHVMLQVKIRTGIIAAQDVSKAYIAMVQDLSAYFAWHLESMIVLLIEGLEASHISSSKYHAMLKHGPAEAKQSQLIRMDNVSVCAKL